MSDEMRNNANRRRLAANHGRQAEKQCKAKHEELCNHPDRLEEKTILLKVKDTWMSGDVLCLTHNNGLNSKYEVKLHLQDESKSFKSQSEDSASLESCFGIEGGSTISSTMVL